MADITSDTSQNEKAWFNEISWKQGLIVAILSFLFGGSGGGFVATKTSQAQGISQDAADGRYLTKEKADVNYLAIEAADKRGEKRDKQFDRIEQKIDANQQKNENDQKENKNLLIEILQNQKAQKWIYLQANK